MKHVKGHATFLSESFVLFCFLNKVYTDMLMAVPNLVEPILQEKCAGVMHVDSAAPCHHLPPE